MTDHQVLSARLNDLKVDPWKQTIRRRGEVMAIRNFQELH